MIRFRAANSYGTNGIIDDLSGKLYDAFNTAVERGHPEIYKEVYAFIQKQLAKAFQERAREVISQFIYVPSFLYARHVANTAVSNYLLSNSIVFFSTLSSFAGSGGRGLKDVGPEYQFDFFNGVISLLHYALQHPDDTVLKNGLQEFQHIRGTGFPDHFNTRLRIIRANTAEEKLAIHNNSEDIHKVEILHRRTTLALYSWAVLLFANNVISLERFKLLVSSLNPQYQYFEDLLSDVIFIRKNEVGGYLGLSGWDYMERPSGVVYNPPSAYYWVLEGMVFYLLSGSNPHFDTRAVSDDRDFSFLHNGVKEVLTWLEQSISKWGPALGLIQGDIYSQKKRTEEIFQERSREILNVFQQLKLLHDRNENKSLADEPLSKDRIEEFRQLLFKSWDKQNFSISLFEQFSKVKPVVEEEGLDFMGIRFFVPQFRKMLVENNYQQIYGAGDIGSQAGRIIDANFIRLISREYSEEAETVADIETGLKQAFSKFENKDFKPDLIIIPPEAIYKTNLTELKDYRRSNEPNDIGSMGFYKEVPIITFYAKNLTNQVIVANFENAFKFTMYESEKLISKRLSVTIRPISKEEIENELLAPSSRKDQDGFELTEEEARGRLATTMYIELGIWGKFEIVEREAAFFFLLTLSSD
ncbi:hypothetical protein VRU48_19115 [Pedobacter sp. KR3-3]|uniref:Uncharacterized protein n=1 Tax=Pedobacter albus TaxID=3113905 RepID=A0ABU7ICN4_9SPHI|nr:hypothetical protein [Pedobacter sp. KR3-3]MEE1947245.1 hypothetical protein [Pedobacter sp. KR3-3]